MFERMEYDQVGCIIFRIFVDGKMWSYMYLEKFMVLLLYSQRQYIFEFDKNDCFFFVMMFNVVWQILEIICLVGYYRNIYQFFEGNVLVIQDFIEDGYFFYIFYLGIGCRVIYKYGKLLKLVEILYDIIKVSFIYDEMVGMLKIINLQNEGFICIICYCQIGFLIDWQIFCFIEEGMVNVCFDYNYDNSFWVISMQVVINEILLFIDFYCYDDVLGKIEQFGKFGVIYYDINQIIIIVVMIYIKYFDVYGRMKEVQYEIFCLFMYWMIVQYDNMG